MAFIGYDYEKTNSLRNVRYCCYVISVFFFSFGNLRSGNYNDIIGFLLDAADLF